MPHRQPPQYSAIFQYHSVTISYCVFFYIQNINALDDLLYTAVPLSVNNVLGV
jgi:hypothetical protein